MRWLDEAILSYTETDAYPFHMPGAKRQNPGLLGDPFRYDLTEIKGFDDLRHAEGLLAELEQQWAALYHAKYAYLSVNGSTGSNLSVIFAATSEDTEVLVPTSAHWSVHNAISLRGAKALSLSVEPDAAGVVQAVVPEAVEEMLRQHPAIGCVVITSPSYEGMVSDIKRIADIVHQAGAALVVDAAHGAHFGLPIWESVSDDFKRHIAFPNPVSLGADAVVVSLHKTLPVLGQTSLILLPEHGRIPAEEIKRYLNMFQTSSPSYLLMSAAAAGCRFLMEEGAAYAKQFAADLKWFYHNTNDLQHLAVLKNDNQDLSKIVITTNSVGILGQALMDRLRDDAHLELERAGAHYALALCSLMDRREGFWRLNNALWEIDNGYKDQ